MTPFQSAGGRRPNAAASLLVHFAAQLMKKQIHVDPGTDATLVRSFSERLASADGSGKGEN